MESNEIKKSRADIYREHVLKAESFEGSARDYCLKHGLDASLLYRYRSLMGFSKKEKQNNSFAKLITKPQSIPNLISKEKIKLPDAKWLAEFLHYYVRTQ